MMIGLVLLDTMFAWTLAALVALFGGGLAASALTLVGAGVVGLLVPALRLAARASGRGRGVEGGGEATRRPGRRIPRGPGIGPHRV